MKRAEFGRKGGVGSGGGDPAGEPPPVSRAMQRVLDALLEGTPPPPDAQDSLTPAERDEISALARTAHLTRLSLIRPEPNAASQDAALARAQATLSARAASGALHPSADSEEASPFWQAWWERLTRNKSRGSSDGSAVSEEGEGA